MSREDRLYAGSAGPTGPFRFDRSVVDVFPDMIRRSVPGYGLVIEQLGILAQRFARAGTVVYDLGCSLGAATLALRHGITVADCRVVAVDSSAAMVERCRQVLARDPGHLPVAVREADITTLAFEPCSLVVMNYTLQFLPIAAREPLLQRIHASLVPGGALVLAEKLSDPDPSRDAFLAELHRDFKRANGYSELEIARKRAALEEVLHRESADAHRERLLRCGFERAECWFQCLGFGALIAVR